MPMAIELLKQNILTTGDLYEGDLLANVISKRTFDYWTKNRKDWEIIVNLIKQNKKILTGEMIMKHIPEFMKIYHI